jgi:hypothetical protein
MAPKARMAHLSSINLSAWLILLWIYQCNAVVYLFIYLSIHPPIYLSTYLASFLFIHSSLYLSYLSYLSCASIFSPFVLSCPSHLCHSHDRYSRFLIKSPKNQWKPTKKINTDSLEPNNMRKTQKINLWAVFKMKKNNEKPINRCLSLQKSMTTRHKNSENRQES